MVGVGAFDAGSLRLAQTTGQGRGQGVLVACASNGCPTYDRAQPGRGNEGWLESVAARLITADDRPYPTRRNRWVRECLNCLPPPYVSASI